MLSSHRWQDKSVIRLNRIVIGVWSVGYRKHRTLISGSSADDRSGSGQNLYERGGSDQMSAVTPVIILQPTYQWRISLFSHGQVSCASCYLPVIVRHYSDELRWSPDENVLPVSHQCLVTIGLPTGCSDHTPASNVPAPYLRDKLKCVRPISDEIGRKWKIRFPTSFRPTTGLCGRGALNWREHTWYWCTLTKTCGSTYKTHLILVTLCDHKTCSREKMFEIQTRWLCLESMNFGVFFLPVWSGCMPTGTYAVWVQWIKQLKQFHRNESLWKV